MKLIKYMMPLLITITLFSCSTTRFNNITTVNPNQQITGKGTGRPITVTYLDDTKTDIIPTVIETPVSLYAKATTSVKQLPKHHIVNNKLAQLMNPAINTLQANSSNRLNASSTIEQQKSVQKLMRRMVIREGFRHLFSNNNEPVSQNTALLCIIAIFLPPLAVGLAYGISKQFWIDFILWLLFYLPGLIYALVVILNKGYGSR